jgi:peptidoglycan-N-acetylglucosamine deacetylase
MGQLLVGMAVGLTVVGSALTALPRLMAQWAQLQSPDVLFHADISRPAVALTIDDGPSAATAEILDVLREHGVGATFFVIGSHLTEHPDLVARMVAEGHELGHHMLYDERSIALPADTFAARFDAVDSMLDELGGSRVFRPGSGWFDQQMVEQAAERGYRTVLGSVYPFDAHLPSVRFASWYLLQNLVPGAIVVLHDGADRGARTAEVLRRVLPELHRQGYAVVSVSDLLAMKAAEQGR